MPVIASIAKQSSRILAHPGENQYPTGHPGGKKNNTKKIKKYEKHGNLWVAYDSNSVFGE